MTAIYIIDHTDPANGNFRISPNKLDGPGSVTQNTNLRLYGAGSLQYGEGVNENFLKILENFASPELGGSPATTAPDPAFFDPAYSVKGQLWFNSTTNKLMMFDGTNWVSAGGVFSSATAPPNPQDGDLWFDTVATQLKVYYAMVWTSTADHYVLKSGDTMDSAANITFAGGGEVLGLPASPSATGAASKEYVDGLISSNNELWELSDVEDDVTSSAVTGEVLYFNGTTWENRGLISTDISGVTSSIQTQLDAKVAKAGSTMTGALTLSGAPTNTLHAATKAYVDAKPLITTSSSTPGTAKDGDIWVDSLNTQIKIYAFSTWNIIFPAQYS